MALSAGTRLGPYEILEPLGAGGMGEVYRARDPRLKREVALKVLPVELASEPERLERFEREAQALAALSHPNIVTIFSVEEADDLHFLTMELVEGKTLTKVIPRAGLPLSRFFRIAIPLTEAVSAAHEKGITHRDLKPGNVMVTEEDRVKVLDFGLAKLREGVRGAVDTQSPTEPATGPGRILGTAPYMAPEQVQGKSLDHRSDVFALGIILYEMATGERPFGGDTFADVASSILKDTPRPVTERKADLPRDLGKLIKHCLEKEPRKRFQSALDLANELDELRQEVDTGDAVVSTGAPITVRAANGKRRMWLVGGAAVAALALGVGYLQTRSPPEPPPEEMVYDERKMLVVLPFENLGAPEDAYFAAGMTEEITSRLAVVSGLGVISRSSAIQYEKSGKSAKQIGEELGVDYVLEGTVRWQKGEEGSSRVRVTPQLIRVSDDTHVWAERYDEVTEDFFRVQSDIAESVIKQLDIALLGRESEAIQAHPTDNLEAYQAYLRGIEHWAPPDDHLEWRGLLAIEMFERAVELDPQFALAYCRLSMAHSTFFWYDHDRSEERLSKAMEAVEHAFSLQPDLPAAHTALGFYFYWGKRDYDRALRELAIAEKGSPNDSLVLEGIGLIQRRLGRFEESLETLEKAIQLSPLESYLLLEQAYTCHWLRRYGEAERYYDLAISAHPDAAFSYVWKARMEWAWNGRVRQARATLEAMPTTDDPVAAERWFWQEFLERDYEQALERLDSVPVEYSGHFWVRTRSLLKARLSQVLDEPELAREGFEEARVILERGAQKQPDPHRYHSRLGIAYAGLGRKEEAIREGKRAVELFPISRDAYWGPWFIEDLALIYTMVGEHDTALEQIEYLLSIPSDFSVGLLELDPSWDPLREHSRYQAIVEKYSLPASGTSSSGG